MSGSLVSKQDNQGLDVLCQIPIVKATVNLLHNIPWNDNELWSTYMAKTHFVHETKFISHRCRCNESEDRSLEQGYFPSRKWNSSVCVAVACRIHDCNRAYANTCSAPAIFETTFQSCNHNVKNAHHDVINFRGRIIGRVFPWINKDAYFELLLGHYISR